MPQISIIIPVYNVKQYLSRCLDSILAQTVTEFECILVDDGSMDGSGRICDEYSQKDNRIKVIHAQNGGPAAARNKGLEKVKAPWVTFVDADDYVKIDYLKNFLKYNTDDFTTQVIQGYHTLGYEGEEIDTLYQGTTYMYHEVIEGGRSIYIEENNILYNWAVWCKVFAMDLIKENDLRFEESVWCGEDGAFWHKYLCFIKKLIFIPERGYVYFCPRQFSSISRIKQHQSVQAWIDLAHNYKMICEILPKKFKMGYKYAAFLRMYYLNYYFWALIKSSDLTTKQIMQLQQIRPSRFYAVWTVRGMIYWILNLFPIRFVRKLVHQ